MGTTSEKLTYLNTTKEKIRDSINLTGANLTSEDTFRSYATKLNKGYIDIINNGIDTLYNNFPKVSGIGSNLSLTPTYEAPMKLNEIQGDTLQENTPTPDSPVEIQNVTGLQNVEVCGKNLLDTSSFYNGYVDSSGNIKSTGVQALFNYIRVNPGESYTISSQGTVNSLNIAQYDINKNFISRTVQSNNPRTFTLGNTTYYIRIWTKVNDDTPMTQTIVNGLKLQLETGSSATEYEPYKSNTYEVNLGKNLFSSEMELGTLNNSTGLPATETNCIRTKDYIEVKPNTTYIISNNKNYQQIIYQYDSSYNLIIANTQNSSFTTTATTKYIKLRTGVSNVENDLTSLWQLEKGSQATSYSPYFTPIELNKIGDYQDRIYKDNGKWYLEKNIGKVVLDSSESGWSYNDVNQVFIVPNLVNYLRSGFVPYSNYYQGQSVTLYNQVENNHIAFLQNTTQNRLLIKNLNYTGVDAFKTWLSTHNTEVLYVLNTPTDTQITDTELIEDLEILYTAKSQEGTTNISITSEDLEMILNVSALKGEV